MRKRTPSSAAGCPRWRRIFFGLLAAALFGLAAPAPASAAPPAPEVATADLEALVATIEDDSRRQDFVNQLKALIAVRRGATAAAPIESLGAGFIAALFERIEETSGELVAMAEAVSDWPLMLGWFRAQATDAALRTMWFDLLFKLAAILAVGLAVGRLAALVLRRPARALEDREGPSLVVRIPLLVARGVLDLVPIAAFVGAAYAVMPLLRPDPKVYVVALTVINAYVIIRGVLVVARMLLVPAAASLQVLPLGGETANYLFIWVRRLVAVSASGYFLAEATLLLGLPAGGYAGLLRLVGLLIASMVVILVLQNRAVVADWIRGRGEAGARGFGVDTLRERFADIWHVLAIIYVAGVYGVSALGVKGGFEFILRATLVSAVILAAARLAMGGLRQAVERGFAINEDVKARYPTLEARANRYLPVLHLVVRGLIAALAVLALLQAWGLDAFGWLDSPLGKRLSQGTLSILTVLVIALLIWETANSAIERYLAKVGGDGRPIERSARARTLLPLLRNVLFVMLAVMVALIVLAELGVNIAPLLAGAGVVGLAIGFGSQKLVQDVITGVFILVEDTIAVGDVVRVGDHAGVVEALSIRSIRLRDQEGQVHTIPFSSVNTVTNLTKEFAYHVLEVGVGYREDVDQVMDVLRGLGAELRADPAFAPLIAEPLEVLGLDRFADSAVIIKARIKTAAGQQWKVGREFNRRLKKRFDELGIELPYPHATIYFGEAKAGSAPAAAVLAEDKDRRNQPG